MYKQFSIVLILAGLAIGVYAVTASPAFGEETISLFRSFADHKWVLVALAGIVMSVIGVIGLVRDNREKKRRSQSAARRNAVKVDE